MVCPNCKSNDIVAIQGQHYCLNCGQLVPETASAPVAPPVSADLAAKIAGTPLKIIGDTPAPSPKSPPVKVQQATATKPEEQKTSVSPIIKVTTRNRLDIPMQNKAGEDKLTTAKKPALRTDIKPPPALPAAPSVKSSTQKTPAVKVFQPKPAPVVSHTVASVMPPASSLRLKQPVDSTVAAVPTKEHSNHNFHTPLVALSALATVSGFALVVTLTPNPLLEIAGWVGGSPPSISPNLTSLSVAVIIAGLLWLIYTLGVLAQSALSFAKVRKASGRSVKDEVAKAAAKQSYFSTIDIDLRMGFWLVGLVVIEIGLVRYVAAVTASLPTAEPYLLAACTIIVAYYCTALVAVRNLSVVFQTVTGSRSSLAIHKGWELFHRHTIDIMAGMMLTIVFDLLFGLPAFAAWLYLKMTPGDSSLRLPATIVWLVLTALGIYLISNYSINFWSKLYTEAASVLPSDQSAELLGARNTSKNNSALIVITVIIAVGLIAAGAWQTGWVARLPQLFQAWLIR